MRSIKNFNDFNEGLASRLNPVSNYKKLLSQSKEIESQISNLEKELDELRSKRKSIEDREEELKDNPKYKWEKTMSKT